MIIIGILGNKQVGKDTFADLLCCKYNFVKYSFAKPLKETCKVLYDLSEHQLNDPVAKEIIDNRWDKTPRQILQFIGTDIVRQYIDENFWIKKFDNWIVNNHNNKIVVPDIRFKNELDALKERGAFIIKIKRPNLFSNDDHSSEHDLDEFHEYDLLIDNIFNTKTEYESFLIEIINNQILSI